MKIIFDIPDVLGPVTVVDALRFMSGHISPLDMLVSGDTYTVRLSAEISRTEKQ